jgi:excisionase family DNA binding protein
MNPEAVTVDVREAAARLGLGYVKTYELITSGELRTIRVGKRRLVPVAALAEWVAAKVAEQEAVGVVHSVQI